jgi:branched-chain amino acid transport system permease protein
LAQLLINTLQIGALYVLFSLGFTLVFGVMKVINMAHGEFFAAAAVVTSFLVGLMTMQLALPSWLVYLAASIIAAIVVCIIGALVYLFGIRFYIKDLVGSFILSVGVLLVIQGAVLQGFGGAPRIVPPIFDGTTEIFGARITTNRLVISLAALLITFATYLALQATRWGKALRAVAEDAEAATLQGIPRRRVSFVGFMIATLLAALAGILTISLAPITPAIGEEYLIKSFIIVIIGGLGSIPGAVIGGFSIALIESVVGAYWDPSIATIVMFALVIAFLIFRPQGIFGRAA